MVLGKIAFFSSLCPNYKIAIGVSYRLGQKVKELSNQRSVTHVHHLNRTHKHAGYLMCLEMFITLKCFSFIFINPK